MKKWSTSLLLMVCLLSGCAAVEPENRVFPLIVSMDYQENQFQVMYGMPNMSLVTGQDKSTANEEQEKQITMYTGSTLEEARERFDLSQEKYLDLGHVKVLVLGSGIYENPDKRTEVLAYLENIPSVAGNLYVFTSDQLLELMELNGNEIDSLGDYITGMIENKPGAEKKDIPQLYDLYNAWHNEEEFPELIKIGVKDSSLYLD